MYTICINLKRVLMVEKEGIKCFFTVSMIYQHCGNMKNSINNRVSIDQITIEYPVILFAFIEVGFVLV